MRTIDVTVNGQFVRLGSKSAGVQGEYNAAALRLTFSEDWRDLTKRVVWRDAEGENPVTLLLYPNGLDAFDALEYTTNIPGEPLGKPGWCSFTLEGYRSGSVVFSAAAHMEVLPNDQFYRPAEPTPSESQQIEEMLAETLREARNLIDENSELLSFWEPWDENKLYKPLQKVSWRGSSYVCKSANVGEDPEIDVAGGVEGAYWLLIARKGDKGDQGPVGGADVHGVSVVPNIQVGTVVTLPAGSEATVTRDPNSPDDAPVFDFGIPRGAGARGARYFPFTAEDWEGGETPYTLTLPLGWEVGTPTILAREGDGYVSGLWRTECVKVAMGGGSAALTSPEKFDGLAVFS